MLVEREGRRVGLQLAAVSLWVVVMGPAGASVPDALTPRPWVDTCGVVNADAQPKASARRTVENFMAGRICSMFNETAGVLCQIIRGDTLCVSAACVREKLRDAETTQAAG